MSKTVSKKLGAKGRKRHARRTRVARKLEGSERPQLIVYRSARHIYAQIVDPERRQTITAASTLSPGVRGEGSKKLEAARRVGQAIAARAREKQIAKVVFNRNGFLYHGRVKALADGAREAGLEF
jgi:large subunit ribosomal protein L18